MKKLILCLALGAFAASLQAGETKEAKDKASSSQASCCSSKSSCTKPKVQSPKGAEQTGK